MRADAIATIWIEAARAIGWRVERGDSAYASSDGRGTILIGVDETLDLEDSPAQLIFHELCHGVVEGPTAWASVDWGLSNSDRADASREHACLRVQAHLTAPHGLRALMAPNTEYRAYHDAIDDDPLVRVGDAAAELARRALQRPEAQAWIDVIDGALAATRTMLDAVATSRAGARENSKANARAGERHPVGFAYSGAGGSCADCAWIYVGGRGHPVERCRQSAGPDGEGLRTESGFHACVRWEPRVDCRTCGACCREAYHSVTVSMRDPVVWKQPHLIERRGHRFEIRREGERCAALDVRGGARGADADAHAHGRKYSCSIYDDRPRPCREFEAGGAHCLVARRRVGLSP